MSGECFVYEDWTCEDQPRCFYVGYGNLKRVALKRRNRHHTNIVLAHGMQRIIVASLLDEIEAKSIEVTLIKQRRTYVYADDYVFGANYTSGGDGVNSRTASVNARKQWAEDYEVRRLANEQRWQKPGEREKLSQSLKVSLNTDEAHAKKHANMVERWQDPVYREQRAEDHRGRWKDETWRVATSQAIVDGRARRFGSPRQARVEQCEKHAREAVSLKDYKQRVLAIPLRGGDKMQIWTMCSRKRGDDMTTAMQDALAPFDAIPKQVKDMQMTAEKIAGSQPASE